MEKSGVKTAAVIKNDVKIEKIKQLNKGAGSLRIQ